MTLVTASKSVGGGLLLARLRGWFLFAAVPICIILFAGLVHDFSQTDASTTWFVNRPIIPGLLLAAGYVFMLLHRIASARRGGEG
jgi:hypothetical protein